MRRDKTHCHPASSRSGYLCRLTQCYISGSRGLGIGIVFGSLVGAGLRSTKPVAVAGMGSQIVARLMSQSGPGRGDSAPTSGATLRPYPSTWDSPKAQRTKDRYQDPPPWCAASDSVTTRPTATASRSQMAAGMGGKRLSHIARHVPRS